MSNSIRCKCNTSIFCRIKKFALTLLRLTFLQIEEYREILTLRYSLETLNPDIPQQYLLTTHQKEIKVSPQIDDMITLSLIWQN